MRPRSALHGYQNQAANFLRTNPYAALWLGLGLGKTSIAITAMADLIDTGEVRKALIVAPLRVAAQTWPAELGAWEHTAHLGWTLIRVPADAPEIGEARAIAREACKRLGIPPGKIAARAATVAEERVRERLLREATPVHIINREMIPWLVRKWGRRWPYDLIIYDESSGLRDVSTQRVRALAYARKNLARFWQLTGTPMPESYEDLFPQIYLLDRGERLGKSVTAFRDRYFSFNRYTRQYKLLEGSGEAIIDRIRDLTLVMRAEDYLPLNEPVFVDRIVELSPEDRTRYETTERTAVLSLASGVEIAAETAVALGSKLLQFASGAVYDEARDAHWAHDAKIDALRDIVEEAQGAPIIVAYWFKSSLARLLKAFPQGRAMDRDGVLQTPWNEGKVPIMFLHPMSGGHGLNLQHGGHLLVWFDTPYSYELYIQTVGRIARQGQTKVPRVFHLSAKGTLDELIVPVLRRKGSVQDFLFARMKELRRVLQNSRVANLPGRHSQAPTSMPDPRLWAGL